ncbi:exopolysaccharide production protein, putative [Fulvimarina pelagi HTCC2506]|uniref:Exopolysaccharide production protein, putative n=1 Tax=Fulvimarina pelagi HTCC2506 TaxID=314231 RepID=Q0G5C8_9HYPH|nr:O-antigen ligase [Fulvimarina pelagi]EAU43136.1 exopolysaccharide production protein, putative [Fulvimarina pelagi HTCC2506]
MQQTIITSRPIGISPEERVLSAGRALIAIVLMTALVMTLMPFPGAYDGFEQADGNPVNKYGYSALALIALLGHLLFADRRVAATLLRPAWLILAAWLVFASVNSVMPELAFRAALFTIAAMIAATGALSLPASAAAFRLCLTVMALAVLGLSYFGVLFLPEMAIHQAFELESQHAGLWRGVYSHKNVTGQVIAPLFFIGIYLWRAGQCKTGILIAVLSFVFAYHSGSKTTLALIPAVTLLVLSGRILGGRILPVILVLVSVTAIGMMTLGTVLSDTLDSILQSVMPGTTFTGRTDLWRFTLDLMRPQQWIGYGIDSFWPTPIVMAAEAPFELGWDPRGIVNAHNGYLDIAITLGWPGLAFALLVLFVLPLADYVKCRDTRENALAADLFLMILTFMLMNAFLESFFFARGHPGWMLTWIAVVGLRLTARHPMKASG